MAEVYLTERFAASIRAGRSLKETVNDISAAAGAEALPLLEGFLQAPGADGLLDLQEERLFRLMAQVSAAFTALAVATVCRTGAFVRRALASVQQAAVETSPWHNKGLRETEVRFLGGLAFRFKTPYLIPLRPFPPTFRDCSLAARPAPFGLPRGPINAPRTFNILHAAVDSGGETRCFSRLTFTFGLPQKRSRFWANL